MNGIPVVDLSQIHRGGRHRTEVVVQVAEACADWGFFQILNHGMPVDLLARVWREIHHFFALPRREKLSLLRTRENPRGFYDRELTKNTRDLKEVFDFGVVLNPALPDEHPENRDLVNGFNRSRSLASS